MEVAATEKIDSKTSRIRNNSFECDSSDIDSILGICSIGNSFLRVDNAELPRPSHLVKRDAQVHAPLEVAIADNSDAEFKRQRLLRLLDHQQAWYDAEQQAVSAAEQFLSLCEHHQQQWLQSNQQTQTPSLTIRT